jgi:hypothetical protein
MNSSIGPRVLLRDTLSGVRGALTGPALGLLDNRATGQVDVLDNLLDEAIQLLGGDLRQASGRQVARVLVFAVLAPAVDLAFRVQALDIEVLPLTEELDRMVLATRVTERGAALCERLAGSRVLSRARDGVLRNVRSCTSCCLVPSLVMSGS